MNTHNGVYLHWKLGTILIQACKICSTKELLQNELKRIEKEFIKTSGYPKWVFDQFNEECRFPRNAVYENNVTINNASINATQRLTLPDKCEQRQKIIKSVNNYIKRLLPENNAAQHLYKSRNVGSSFNIKDQN